MNYNEVNYDMHLDFLRREIVRDLEETVRYNQQIKTIAYSLSHLPVELRPSPIKRQTNTNKNANYVLKPYKHISISK
jgi:hypothetical protein